MKRIFIVPLIIGVVIGTGSALAIDNWVLEPTGRERVEAKVTVAIPILDIDVEPDFIDFGTMAPGETKEFVLTITNTGAENIFDIDYWLENAIGLDVYPLYPPPMPTIPPTPLLKPGENGTFPLALSVSPDAPWGTQNFTIVVQAE